MTHAERQLLIWCSVMLLRDTPLSAEEADEIDKLIATARDDIPVIRPISLVVIESARAERERYYPKIMARRYKIFEIVVFFLAWLITTLLVFGIAASILYTPLFSPNWWSQFLGTLGSYLVGIFLYWEWGKIHSKSRDKTTAFLRKIPSTLWKLIRGIRIRSAQRR